MLEQGCVASVPCRLMEGPSSCEDEDIGFESRSWRFLLHMHGLGVKGASLVYILVVPTAIDNLFIYAIKKIKVSSPSQPQPEM